MSNGVVECGRRWCARETSTRAHDGSLLTFHHGTLATVLAGDDAVTAALVATDDDPDVTYVEVNNAVVDEAHNKTVWLTLDEAGGVAAVLAALAADAVSSR